MVHLDSLPCLRHSDGMLACISYDTNYTSKWTGPLWLVYSVANAKWFAQQSTLAQGSAVFYLKNDERPGDSLLRVLWEIEDHHPKVADIQIQGLALSTAEFNALSPGLQNQGFDITERPAGFIVNRRHSSL
ncbi:hypothetical protein N1037_13070 [Phaeobacter sp. G2]|nr:hypothetical protein N1037_13070 [Phaeobacter sp. G2]